MANESPDKNAPEETVLIAADSGPAAERAVRYAGRILSDSRRFRVILFSLVSHPEAEFYESPEEQKQEEEKREKSAGLCLEKYVKILEDAGLPRERMETRVRAGRFPSIAEEILREMSLVKARTLIAGRRGIPRSQEFLMGSSTSSLLHNLPPDHALWIVD